MKSSHEQFRDYRVSFSIADGELLQKLAALPVDQRAAAIELLLEIQSRKQDEAARESFMPFVRRMWPAFIEGAHHKKMADAFERVARGELKRVIINMPPRHCLALDTPIMTTRGWKTMASLSVGDSVYGPDGKPTKVVGKSEVHHGRDCFRVTTDDGASVVCDEGHLWNAAVCRKRPSFRNWTAGELYRRRAGRRAWLPDYEPVDYEKASLPLDPYTFGVWLGDGSSYDTTITMSPPDQAEVIDRINAAGVTTTVRKDPMTFGMKGVKVILRDMGVLANKHIPAQYLMASVEDRLALLDGLMDTDGNVTKGRQCFVATSSPVLRDQIRELLWSLGMKNGVSVSRAVFNGRDYGETYRIGFYASGVGTLKRKRERATGHIKKVRRYISLERVGSVPVQCIEVDREDGLFLAGHGFMVTHNTKSEFASFLFPAWFLGKFPDKKVIQASHTAELAKDFGRNVRNLIGSEDYQRIFNGVELAPDNKAAGRWNTNKRGTYFAVGVDGAVAGKGADILVIDDPHNEQEATLGEWNPAVYDKVYKWYTSGPRQRLQPNGAIIIVMTRWSLRDLTGQIIDHAAENDALDEWEVIELPAILPSGNALWPEFWSLAALNDIKRDIPISKWNAQYQQHPTSEEGALIKREWWRVWDRQMPECVAILQSWDTAIEQTERANYSACTTWGIFEHPDTTGRMQHNLILLDAERGKWEFPELKAKAKQLYQKYTPDQVIIERRASGAPLLFELRSMGIPVSAFMPTRGNDKIVRVNAVTDIFASGFVWAPPTAWAREVMEECAAFPAGKDDDFVDSTTQALLRFRQGGYIGTSGDDYDDEPEYRPVKKYY